MTNINIYKTDNITTATQNINKIISATPTLTELDIVKTSPNTLNLQQSINNVNITSKVPDLSLYATLSDLTAYAQLPVTYNSLSSDNKRRVSRAWVVFNSIGVLTILNSYNILSITDNGTGDYTINFITPFSNSNYCFVTWSRDRNTDNYIYSMITAKSNTPKTPSSIRLLCNYFPNATFQDSPESSIIFFGD